MTKHVVVKSRNLTKRLIGWAFVVGVILLIPIMTKAFWTSSDYIFAGVVLYVLAASYELITRNMKEPKHKLTVALAIFGVIILILGWAATGPD